MPHFASGCFLSPVAKCPLSVPGAMQLQVTLGRFHHDSQGFRGIRILSGSGTAIVTQCVLREVLVITGEEIRRLRGKESQAEFAHRLGVSASTVCRWEASDTRPSPLALRSLMKLRKRAAALSTALKT